MPLKSPHSSKLSYDLVVATRNRPDALALSLPLMIRQSFPPARLIVVDASDDTEASAKAVAVATRGWSGAVIVEHSPPGLPRQRNRGLAHVTAPVVVFFDDDSLLHDGAAAAIMEVYERDTDGAVVGVCAAEAMTPPDGVLPDTAWEMSAAHRREANRRGIRNSIERRLTVLKPALFLGRILNGRNAMPHWLADFGAVPVEYMTGFRMTFRTAAIRRTGFDEALGGYALDEDIDASFSAMASGLVVGARRARIYHHRRPGGRGQAYEAGRMAVENRAHVLLKHAAGPCGSDRLLRAVWRRQRIFMALQLTWLLSKAHTEEGRTRLAGAWTGALHAVRLRRQPPDSSAAGVPSVTQDLSAA